MSKKTVAALLIAGFLAQCAFSMPSPKIYLPFENSQFYAMPTDPVWMNRAPDYPGVADSPERGKIYSSTPPLSPPLIATGGGVGGSDCLDLSMATQMKGTCGSLYYGKLTNTVDAWFSNTPAEAAFDGALSLTVTGWFNTKDPAVAIDTNAPGTIPGARLFNKYGQMQLLAAKPGKLSLILRKDPPYAPAVNTTKTVNSDANMFNQKNQWVFFAVTFNGSVTEVNGIDVKFYMGTEASAVILAGQGTTGGNYGALINKPGEYLIIGNYGIGSANGASSFKGYLDDFRVFSSTTDASGALSINDIESIRRKDIGLGNPTYLAGDIDKDYKVNFKDAKILADNWLTCTDPTNPDCVIAIPAATIYFPFDNSDGAPYDVNDPAFVNHGAVATGEKPTYIRDVNYPNPDSPPPGINTLSISPNGVNGSCLDLTLQPMSTLASMLVYGSIDSTLPNTGIQDALNDAKSMTVVCWWKQSREQALTSAAYLMRRVGQFSVVSNKRTETGDINYFGEMAFDPNSSTYIRYSPLVYPDVDSWVFFAVTFDGTATQQNTTSETDTQAFANGRLKWYRGTLTRPVNLHTSVEFTPTVLPEIMSPATGKPLIIGNSTYNTSALGNFSALIDEMRIYVSKTDGTGALSVDQLESIRLHDAISYNYKNADINKDKRVNFKDLVGIGQTWLQCNAPISCN